MLKTVVVVDDNPTVREVMVEVLRYEGYRVLEADGAQAAWRALSMVRGPCVAIIDVVMPDIDGIELMERLCEDERTRDVALIACTASLAPLPTNPPVGRLAKPFGAQALVDSVRSAFASTSTPSTSRSGATSAARVNGTLITEDA